MSVVEHKGIIQNIEGKKIEVQILVNSSCDGCHMKGGCISGSDTSKRLITIDDSHAENYSIGEEVTLFFSEKMGGKVVTIAYIIPVVICVVAVIVLLNLGVSEPASALFALSFIVAYFVCLYIIKEKIQSKITIKIKNKN
ncbi:MAG: SoxR reducing system RseC family protein [Rikenellaceae bacterium]